jgi:hypothetical protein
MLMILQEPETNDCDGTATGDESWFQHITAFSKMFTRSAVDAIPRRRQVAGAKATMITMLCTAKKLIVLDVLPKGSTFNQLYFINSIFPVLKTANLDFRRQKTRLTF